MKTILTISFVALVSVFAFASDEVKPEVQNVNQQSAQVQSGDTDEVLTDIDIIVNKANVAAYYQGDDGKAKVKMTITNKQGQQRLREFIILRKDTEDGGDQKYYVYFQKPADVRKMVFMVH